MEKINLINIIFGLFALGLIFGPSKKLTGRNIFLAGVLLFGVGAIFILVKYMPVAEIYLDLSLLCLIIGVIKTALRYKDEN